jgi:D-alanine--D-alanine ligase
MAMKHNTQNLIRKTEGEFGKIGVLMGGPSSEREISLKSGKAVYEALKKSGLEVVAIDIKTDKIKENINLIKEFKIDCAFLALHGRFGEDGQIQEILEILQIPFTCSGIKASKLAMDKIASLSIFKDYGLNVPRYTMVDKSSYNKNWQFNNILTWPLVIKPVTGGSSIGLSIIDREEQLAGALDLAFTFDDRVIIEEYIRGRELTVAILEEVALPIIEIIPKRAFFDYVAKYQPGMTEYIVPAKLEEAVAEKVRQAACQAHKLLGCFGCSRVDMILSPDNLPFILEVNTIPGLTSTSLLPKAAKTHGIEFSELCLKLIKLAYEKIPVKSRD